jgi:hypothetical protein
LGKVQNKCKSFDSNKCKRNTTFQERHGEGFRNKKLSKTSLPRFSSFENKIVVIKFYLQLSEGEKRANPADIEKSVKKSINRGNVEKSINE